MQAAETDTEIRTNSAFPDVLRAARFNVRSILTTFALFVAATIYWIALHHIWTIVVAVVFSAANVAGQLYAFRLAKDPLQALSQDKTLRERAWKVAMHDTSPRIVRWIPGWL